MIISDRVNLIAESITLRLNNKANQLALSGREIFNLTAGQLPSNPPSDFVESIQSVLSELKSYQYSPVAGLPGLRKNVMSLIAERRGIVFDSTYDCLIGNGGKHVLTNIFASLVNPGDEVICFKPYWISYPPLIKLYDGVVVEVEADRSSCYRPSIEELSKKINRKTRLIVVNSPSNPAGVYYDRQWMADFGRLLSDYPDVSIVSDEIYYELAYDGGKPEYFYQIYPELLARTIIVHGISKGLAGTGLRIGWCIAQKNLIQSMVRLQGQTSSGANSLIQRALEQYDLFKMVEFLRPMNQQLLENQTHIRNILNRYGYSHLVYKTNSAFYFMLDFCDFPILERFRTTSPEVKDHAYAICEEIIEKTGVVIVPGSDFGIPNAARISMVLTPDVFSRAIEKLISFLSQK